MAGTLDGLVRVLELLRSGGEAALDLRPSLETQSLGCLAMDSTSRRLAARSADRKSILLLGLPETDDRPPGVSRTWGLEERITSCPAFGPENQRLAVGTESRIMVLDTSGRQEPVELLGHSAPGEAHVVPTGRSSPLRLPRRNRAAVVCRLEGSARRHRALDPDLPGW